MYTYYHEDGQKSRLILKVTELVDEFQTFAVAFDRLHGTFHVQAYVLLCRVKIKILDEFLISDC